MTDDEFSKRFSAIVDENGGQNAFSRMSGLSQSGIARLVGGGEPTLSTLKTIANVSRKSLLWLATGDQVSASSPGVAQIPILDVAAAAGDGVDNHSDEVISYLPFPLDFLRRMNISPDNVKAIRAYGDSMEPTIPDRALVLIDITKSDLKDGRVYALRAPDGLRIKRIQRQIDGSVDLISDNKAQYSREHLSPSDAERIKVVGRAFWTERLI